MGPERRTERKKMPKTAKMMAYTFSEPPKRLTAKRQALIQEFKKQTLMNPELFGNLGSRSWIDKLRAYLISRNQPVSTDDIIHWIEANKCIHLIPETVVVNQNDQMVNNNGSENQPDQQLTPQTTSPRIQNVEAETPANTESGGISTSNTQPANTEGGESSSSSNTHVLLPSEPHHHPQPSTSQSYHPYEIAAPQYYFHPILQNSRMPYHNEVGRAKKLDDYHRALSACQLIGDIIKQNEELRSCLVPLKNVTGVLCRSQKRLVLDISHKEAFNNFTDKQRVFKQEHCETQRPSTFNQDLFQDVEVQDHINVVDCDIEC